MKTLPAMQEMLEIWVRFLGWEDPLEEGIAAHSSILAWRTPRTEEPGSLYSWGHKESDTTERLTHTRVNGASQVAQWVKNVPAMQEMLEIWVQFLGQENPLEEGTATHSSILAWRIP